MVSTTDILLLAGRLLIGGFFLLSAYAHFANGKAMTAYARSKGVPAPALATYGAGLLLLGGSVSVLAGLAPAVGLALLALFLVGVTPMMHAFWTVKDPMQRMGEQVNFNKNVALLGGVLALFAVETPWALSLPL